MLESHNLREVRHCLRLARHGKCDCFWISRHHTLIFTTLKKRMRRISVCFSPCESDNISKELLGGEKLLKQVRVQESKPLASRWHKRTHTFSHFIIFLTSPLISPDQVSRFKSKGPSLISYTWPEFLPPLRSPPFSISVIKCISMETAWGNELILQLDHVKGRVPNNQWLPPLSRNCHGILAVITEACWRVNIERWPISRGGESSEFGIDESPISSNKLLWVDWGGESLILVDVAHSFAWNHLKSNLEVSQ